MATAPGPVVYLHIGAMKTGTTFLQRLVTANRATLDEAGFLFPGTSWWQQTLATRDVLQLASDPRVQARAAGLWDRLAGRMLEHEGRASLFSMEFLSFADPTGAGRVAHSLRGATLHVILTVRDTTGALPAQWQSNARNGGKVSWPDFVHGAMSAVRWGGDTGGQGGRVFRRAQDIPRILRVWGELVPPDRLHVVTVPPSGSDRSVLWQRFAGVIGVDPDTCTLPTRHSNTSLGHPSADLMRRVNVRLGRIAQSDYDPTMKGYLATRVLSRRAEREQRAKLDLATRRFAAGWNKKVRAAILDSGVHVVGDLEDLPVRVPRQSHADRRTRLADPDPAAILVAAADARQGMARLVRVRARRLRRLGVEVRRPPEAADGLPLGPDRWDDHADPVDAAVEEVTALTREAIELNRRLRDIAPKYARRGVTRSR